MPSMAAIPSRTFSAVAMRSRTIASYPCAPRYESTAHAVAIGAAGRAPATRGRAVEARRPLVVDEELVPEPVLVAVQHRRRALRRVAVLVDVGRDLGDARDAEVPGRHVVPDALEERQHEPADARVDVAARAVLGRERGEVGHRVHDAVRVGERRRDDDRRLGRDRARPRRRRRRATRRRAGSSRAPCRSSARPSRRQGARTRARGSPACRCRGRAPARGSRAST